jgi:hypothetical protein
MIGGASETEDFPIGEPRQYWDPEGLLVKDTERAEYMNRVRAVVLEACRAIIAKLLMPG